MAESPVTVTQDLSHMEYMKMEFLKGWEDIC